MTVAANLVVAPPRVIGLIDENVVCKSHLFSKSLTHWIKASAVGWVGHAGFVRIAKTMSELVIRYASLPVQKGAPQDEVSDAQDRPTAEAGYVNGDAEAESSRREQSRENAALKFCAHQGAVVVGDRLSCHAVREVGVGEQIDRIQDECAPQAAMPGSEVVDPIVVWVAGWIVVLQAQSPRHAL